MWKYNCLSPLDRSTEGPKNAILRNFMNLRLRYVIGMGWLTDIDSDEDIYDDSDRTLYFVRSHDESGEGVPHTIRSGLRMTQVPSFYDSLTWSMLSMDPGRQADIIENNLELLTDINEHAADRGLWDITRLVSPIDGSVSKVEIIQSIYELLGMAMFKTVVEPNADPVWMFLTTSSIKRLFDMSGIECTVLFSGRVTPTDEDDSYLCVAKPRAAYTSVTTSGHLTHRRASQRVLDGCTALQTQELTPTAA